MNAHPAASDTDAQPRATMQTPEARIAELIAPIDENAVEKLAALQIAVLPGSLISRMGVGFVREFYRFAARSPFEIVLFARPVGGADDDVIGGCVASLTPGTLSRRLLLRSSLFVRLFRLPLGVLLAQLAPPAPLLRRVADMPELILLYTHPDGRSRGVGGQLVRECERRLQQQGIREYYVKTLDAADNRAIPFYVREGFEDVGSEVLDNQRYRFLTRKIRIGGSLPRSAQVDGANGSQMFR